MEGETAVSSKAKPKKEKVKLEVLKIEDPAEDVLPEATVGGGRRVPAVGHRSVPDIGVDTNQSWMSIQSTGSYDVEFLLRGAPSASASPAPGQPSRGFGFSLWGLGVAKQASPSPHQEHATPHPGRGSTYSVDGHSPSPSPGRSLPSSGAGSPGMLQAPPIAAGVMEIPAKEDGPQLRVKLKKRPFAPGAAGRNPSIPHHALTQSLDSATAHINRRPTVALDRADTALRTKVAPGSRKTGPKHKLSVQLAGGDDSLAHIEHNTQSIDEQVEPRGSPGIPPHRARSRGPKQKLSLQLGGEDDILTQSLGLAEDQAAAHQELDAPESEGMDPAIPSEGRALPKILSARRASSNILYDKEALAAMSRHEIRHLHERLVVHLAELNQFLVRLLAQREELRNEVEATKLRMAEALDKVNAKTIQDAEEHRERAATRRRRRSWLGGAG